MTAIYSRRTVHNAQPFAGQGASLYLTAGTNVTYRRPRIAPKTRSVLRQGWGGRCPKTLRVASQSGVSGDQVDFAQALSALAAGTYTADVRHYRDGIENLSTNVRTVTFTIDALADESPTIRGTALVITSEIKAGGDVTLTVRYTPDRSGLPPVTLRLTRTAGPTTPSDVDLTYDADESIYEFDLTGLSDASAYTFKLQAINGATTVDILTGISLTADASGPPTPTLVSATAQ